MPKVFAESVLEKELKSTSGNKALAPSRLHIRKGQGKGQTIKKRTEKTRGISLALLKA